LVVTTLADATKGVEVGPIFQRWDHRRALRTAAKDLGLDPDDLNSLDMRDFRHAATNDRTRKSGHLSGLAYIGGHNDKTTSDISGTWAVSSVGRAADF